MIRLFRAAVAATFALTSALMAAQLASATTSGSLAWVAVWDDDLEVEHNSVQLMDLSTGEILDRVELADSRPAELAYSLSTGNLWVFSQPWNYELTTIAVVNTVDGSSEQGLVDTGDTFEGPDHSDQYAIADHWIGDVATSVDGDFAFVTGYDAYSDDGALLVFDAETTEYVGSVPLTYTDPNSMALNSLTNELYVSTEDDSNMYIETIDLDSTDWQTAAVAVSDALEWPSGAGCASQGAIDFDHNSNTVFAVCWAENGFATFNVGTGEMGSTEVDIHQFDPSTIGIDVSDDGTRIALGTCYHGSFWAELGADHSVSNVVQDSIYNVSATSKPVRFFGDGSHYAAGSWGGNVLRFEGGTSEPLFTAVQGSAPDDTDLGGVYIGSIELTEPYYPDRLADTGFDASTLALWAGATIGAGTLVVVRRRRT